LGDDRGFVRNDGSIGLPDRAGRSFSGRLGGGLWVRREGNPGKADDERCAHDDRRTHDKHDRTHHDYDYDYDATHHDPAYVAGESNLDDCSGGADNGALHHHDDNQAGREGTDLFAAWCGRQIEQRIDAHLSGRSGYHHRPVELDHRHEHENSSVVEACLSSPAAIRN
jgi:hypothetical protein